MPRPESLRLPFRLVLACLPVLAASAVPAAAAPFSQAGATPAPVVFDFVDPPGDRVDPATTSPGLDIVSGTISQNRVQGIIKGAVTFEAPPDGLVAYVHFGLGLTSRSGDCSVSASLGGTAHLVGRLSDERSWFLFGGAKPYREAATRNDIGPWVQFESPMLPNLVSEQRWTCARIDVESIDPIGGPTATASRAEVPVLYDTAVVHLPSGPAPTGPVVTFGPDGKPIVPDADRDGVPDTTDQCRTVAGAGTNGCPTVSGKASLKLSGRTITVDRLLPAVAATCPPVVNVTVKARGKRIGSKRLGVVQHGALCHVQGVVALKKGTASAKVTVAGRGLKTLRRTVRR